MLQGFKEFVMRGNALELAVGVVIAGAFSAIVTAIVDGIINPIIAGLIGKPNFDEVAAFHLGNATVKPGLLITAIINFILIAAAVYFLIVLPMNKLNEKIAARRKAGEEVEDAAVSEDVALLTEIRDLLAAQHGDTASISSAEGRHRADI
ncbi:large conductance mechanosensitive channel protein MscL [Winkia sp. UMB3158]|uniref:Large-conductance mechanosensitive channel n=2 Tax=Winkia neuii TaxID=33007 RepID=K0Z349_9ACTO|nr:MULTISPECIES: large conductance mechanosensitive channel protein MscL [Winkia]MDK8342342.1 large conductance mechanosensitive channel protein MscL [Winkia sp. UMB3164B]OFT39051.1 mechanosensitive ion channel protein MscL [Actinomyces sp. HMSC08A01]PMC92681.1 large conductance mechanosensitive channel protein MscL [Actinomyces sp. UMB0918]EJZ86534.1 large conductance mechanosensitive channel protein [Winkia neuii BV029A5]MBS5946745.1 large conductance mechanosensitive channel protein MscL [W